MALTPEQRARIAGPQRRLVVRAAPWLAAAAALAIGAVPFLLRRESPRPLPPSLAVAVASPPPAASAPALPAPAPAPVVPPTASPAPTVATIAPPRPLAQVTSLETAARENAIRRFDDLIVATPPKNVTSVARMSRDGDLRSGRDSAEDFNTEAYAHREDSDFVALAQHPLSTFSVDVDTASYSNVRRFLNGGRLPPKDAVRMADRPRPIEALSDDFRFAAAVAQFGMILRDSPHKGAASFDSVLALGERGRGPDGHGYRAEFLDLVRKARGLR